MPNRPPFHRGLEPNISRLWFFTPPDSLVHVLHQLKGLLPFPAEVLGSLNIVPSSMNVGGVWGVPPQLVPIVFLVNQPPKGIGFGWIALGLRCRQTVQQAKLLCHHSAHDLVAGFSEMNAVEGQPAALPRYPLCCCRKQIHGVHTRLICDLEQLLRINLQVAVSSRNIHRCRRVLLGDGSHQHHSGRRVPIKLFGSELPHKTLGLVSKVPHPCNAKKRFIHPVTDKHNVGTFLAQLISQARKPQGANRLPHLFRRPSQIPNPQAVFRESAVQKRLEIPEEMHPLGERVADDHDVVVLLYLEVAGPRC